MAATIILSVPINASPETVFTMLTEADGLASFWTSDSQAEPKVGSIAHFGFPSGSRLELRVEELVPDRRIVWTLLNDILFGPRWAGTTVTMTFGAQAPGFSRGESAASLSVFRSAGENLPTAVVSGVLFPTIAAATIERFRPGRPIA